VNDLINTAKTFLKWVVFSIISGVVIGLVGTLFYFSMAFVIFIAFWRSVYCVDLSCDT
jgi:hypothetical protein